MGQQQSKEELLYQQVSYGNVEGIKSLASNGASLEWIDREGKTPLILASLNLELYNVAKTLIELGANVNAYRPGRNGGTPLHHAAKRGLESSVKLLLSHGANPLLMNDDCQTPLEVARSKGYSNVVRAIENHICLFSGWMREFYGPGFLEVLAPQFVSRKVWVVILPTGSRKPTKPFKLELAIYSGLQDAKPRSVIALWKANLEEPKFHQSDPSVVIVDNNTISRGRRRRRARHRPPTIRQTRARLASANEGEKQQLQWFCDACKGIPQAAHPPAFLHHPQTPAVQATAPPSTEDLELAMAINASIQSAISETPIFDGSSTFETSASTSWNDPVNPPNGSAPTLGDPNPKLPPNAAGSRWPIPEAPLGLDQVVVPAPSPSHAVDEIIEDGPIHYPSIDPTPVDMGSSKAAMLGEKKEGDEGSSSCVICLDAPIEGACIPCGHMAGCMSCLNNIKAKKWGCPVCRAKINQIIRLYTV